MIIEQGDEQRKKWRVWITVQTHMNIVAVAVLTEIACIIIPEGIQVEEEVLNKAENEGVVILLPA